jgi:hypothetical protein
MPAHDPHDVNGHSILEPVSAPEGRATSPNVQADAETVTEGAGGFLGAVSGLALGAPAGPVGALLGAIAGAAGGWWAGREVAHALTESDDRFYQTHYEQAPDRLAGLAYEQVRPAYLVGHLAGRNPEYEGRSFEEIEGDLRGGWHDCAAEQCSEWPAMRGYARAAFERARRTPLPR